MWRFALQRYVHALVAQGYKTVSVECLVCKARVFYVLHFDECVAEVEHIENLFYEAGKNLFPVLALFAVDAFAEYGIPVCKNWGEDADVSSFCYKQMPDFFIVIVVCDKHVWLASFAFFEYVEEMRRMYRRAAYQPG